MRILTIWDFTVIGGLEIMSRFCVSFEWEVPRQVPDMKRGGLAGGEEA